MTATIQDILQNADTQTLTESTISEAEAFIREQPGADGITVSLEHNASTVRNEFQRIIDSFLRQVQKSLLRTQSNGLVRTSSLSTTR